MTPGGYDFVYNFISPVKAKEFISDFVTALLLHYGPSARVVPANTTDDSALFKDHRFQVPALIRGLADGEFFVARDNPALNEEYLGAGLVHVFHALGAEQVTLVMEPGTWPETLALLCAHKHLLSNNPHDPMESEE